MAEQESGVTPAREVIVALVNAVAGREDEFNAWYSGQHIPEILELPGFVGAQRYELDPASAPTSGYGYLTIYEVEGSAAEARDRFFSSELSSSDSIERSPMIFAAYLPFGPPLLP